MPAAEIRGTLTTARDARGRQPWRGEDANPSRELDARPSPQGLTTRWLLRSDARTSPAAQPRRFGEDVVDVCPRGHALEAQTGHHERSGRRHAEGGRVKGLPWAGEPAAATRLDAAPPAHITCRVTLIPTAITIPVTIRTADQRPAFRGTPRRRGIPLGQTAASRKEIEE